MFKEFTNSKFGQMFGIGDNLMSGWKYWVRVSISSGVTSPPE